MNLEGSIKFLENMNNTIKENKLLFDENNIQVRLGKSTSEAIETVLQALENLQEEYRQYREFIAVTGGKDVDDITATQYVKIQREGYLRGRKEEQEKAKECILRLQENSISKKEIENKIEYLEIRKAECDDIESKVRLDVKINSYKELLEEK